MQLIKKYRRIWLPMLLVAFLAFGTAMTGLASDALWPVWLENEDFDSGDFGAPDPSCAWLVGEYGFPEDCDLMGVKINDPITGSFDEQTGEIEWGCDATDFDVELTVNGETFDFNVSGYTVYYVWVKAGPGGHLYGYPSGTQSDEGLISPASDSISHITFYYCDLDEPVPALHITKEADTKVSKVGDDINYTVTVTNTGNVDLDVVVDDTLGGELFDDVLPAGQSETFNYSYTVQESDPDPLENTVTATGDHDMVDDSIVVTASEHTDLVEPEITLTKTVSPTTAEVGDDVTYAIEVENTGDWGLENIVVTDELLGGDITGEFDFGSVLAPGDSKEATLNYTITSDDVDANGEVVNTATVSSNPETLPNNIQDQDSAVVNIVGPALTITKGADTQVSKVGDDINYTVLVKNAGDVALNVEVNDTLEGHLFSDLMLQGEEKTFEYSYTVQEGDPNPLENTATAQGWISEVTPHGVSNSPDVKVSATVETPLVEPEITLTKTVDPDEAQVGDEVTYTIEVENTGDWGLENIVVTDELLGGDITEHFGFDDGDTLARGESKQATFDYTITANDIVEDQVVNTASVSSNPVGLPNDIEDGDSAVVDVAEEPDDDEPAVSINKEAEQDEVLVDEVIDYTITVTNTGNVTLNGIQVTDSMLDLDEEIASLAPGDSVVFTGEYVAEAGDVGTLTNTATAEIPDYVHDQDSASVTVSERTAPTPTTYYRLTLNVSPEGAGVATANPDLTRYRRGRSVELFAEANEGYEFSHWVVHGSQVDDADTSVTMWGNREATAYFEMVVDPEPPEAEPEPGISLTKMADVDTAGPGDTITYTFVIENTGETDLTGIVLRDDLIEDGWIQRVGQLEPGETVTFEQTYVIPADTEDDKLINLATVTTSQGVEDQADALVALVEITDEVVVDQPEPEEGPLPETGGQPLLYVLAGGLLMLMGGWMITANRRR